MLSDKLIYQYKQNLFYEDHLINEGKLLKYCDVDGIEIYTNKTVQNYGIIAISGIYCNCYLISSSNERYCFFLGGDNRVGWGEVRDSVSVNVEYLNVLQRLIIPHIVEGKCNVLRQIDEPALISGIQMSKRGVHCGHIIMAWEEISDIVEHGKFWQLRDYHGNSIIAGTIAQYNHLVVPYIIMRLNNGRPLIFWDVFKNTRQMIYVNGTYCNTTSENKIPDVHEYEMPSDRIYMGIEPYLNEKILLSTLCYVVSDVGTARLIITNKRLILKSCGDLIVIPKECFDKLKVYKGKANVPLLFAKWKRKHFIENDMNDVLIEHENTLIPIWNYSDGTGMGKKGSPRMYNNIIKAISNAKGEG